MSVRSVSAVTVIDRLALLPGDDDRAVGCLGERGAVGGRERLRLEDQPADGRRTGLFSQSASLSASVAS